MRGNGFASSMPMTSLNTERIIASISAGDLRHAQERGFDVDLGELGLAVGAQVLVAEALGDLVVAVEAGDHQQLLEQLRGLRQRVELPRVHAAGHQEVARALGRGLGEHGRLDVDEALRVEIAAHRHRHPVAQAQVALHLRAAQVDHAVLQPHVLAQVLLVELEGRRERGIEQLDVLGQHLDLAAGEVGVDRALGPRAHPALDLDARIRCAAGRPRRRCRACRDRPPPAPGPRGRAGR